MTLLVGSFSLLSFPLAQDYRFVDPFLDLSFSCSSSSEINFEQKCLDCVRVERVPPDEKGVGKETKLDSAELMEDPTTNAWKLR